MVAIEDAVVAEDAVAGGDTVAGESIATVKHAYGREHRWGDIRLPAARVRMGGAARSSRQPIGGVPRNMPMWGASDFHR